MSACAGCGATLAPAKRGARKWCSERCRKAQYRVPCLDCGAPCNPIANASGQHCKACAHRRTTEAQREKARPQRELVERLWAEGASSARIAELVGWTGVPSVIISVCRGRGYDLPVRNRGCSIANRGNRNNRHSKVRDAKAAA